MKNSSAHTRSRQNVGHGRVSSFQWRDQEPVPGQVVPRGVTQASSAGLHVILPDPAPMRQHLSKRNLEDAQLLSAPPSAAFTPSVFAFTGPWLNDHTSRKLCTDGGLREESFSHPATFQEYAQ